MKGLRDEAAEAARRRDAAAPLALALLSGDGMFSKIHRYATTAHRALYRALDQFVLIRRLQLSRPIDDANLPTVTADLEPPEDPMPSAEVACSALPADRQEDHEAPHAVGTSSGSDNQASLMQGPQPLDTAEGQNAIEAGEMELTAQDSRTSTELAPSAEDTDYETKPNAP